MNKYLYSLLLIISLALFSACSNDDDDTNVSLESYILGRWHSTSFIANAGQKSAVGNISKNGTYSELYYEIVFSKEGTFTVSHWQQNENYSSSWVTEVGKFIINGDIVFLSDDSGDDPLELNFDKEKKHYT